MLRVNWMWCAAIVARHSLHSTKTCFEALEKRSWISNKITLAPKSLVVLPYIRHWMPCWYSKSAPTCRDLSIPPLLHPPRSLALPVIPIRPHLFSASSSLPTDAAHIPPLPIVSFVRWATASLVSCPALGLSPIRLGSPVPSVLVPCWSSHLPLIRRFPASWPFPQVFPPWRSFLVSRWHRHPWWFVSAIRAIAPVSLRSPLPFPRVVMRAIPPTAPTVAPIVLDVLRSRWPTGSSSK